jgi:excisionase family DNA binding protein
MTRYLKLLTVPEVAKRLTISRRTVYRLIEKKALKAIKISAGIYRVEEKDLIHFLKKHKTK